MSSESVLSRCSRPPRMRSRFSEKGRERRQASWARRTLAAATSFMAEVIFLVFLTEPTRSRSSLMDIMGPAARARGAAGAAFTALPRNALGARPPGAMEKAEADATKAARAATVFIAYIVARE